MIVEKRTLPDDPTPNDAPPSYDALVPPPSLNLNEKPKPIETDFTTPTSSYSSLPGLSENQRSPRPTPTSSSSAKGKGKSAWFGFTTRPAREVRSTVLGLVRDLVSLHQSSSSESKAILDSCVEACNAYDISFSSLLQEKSIELHTPLYWAIVKRPSEDSAESGDGAASHEQGPDLLTAMLSYAAPLTPETLSEIRLACLLTSDQALFQRLRLSPEFSPMSGTDAMLLGAVTPPDDIRVEDVPGDEGGFTVHFEVAHFQKRMRISKRIELEFIARSRMWKLAFFVASDRERGRAAQRPGSWCVALSLMENSPPTWVDSCIIIPEVVQPATSPAVSSPSLIDSESCVPPPQPQRTGNFFERVVSGTMPKSKPPIMIRLKSSGAPLVALETGRRGFSDQTQILVALDESALGGSLQFAGNSYIGSDGSLKACLQAKLTKPDSDQPECVVC